MKIKSVGSSNLFLVTGKNSDRDAWYYILVDKIKLSLYERAVKEDFIKLSKYGEIIYSGWGDSPPNEIKEKIKREYTL